MAEEPIKVGGMYMLTSGPFVLNAGKAINIEGIGMYSISTAVLAELQLTANASSGSARSIFHNVQPASSTLDLGKDAYNYWPIKSILSGVSANVVTSCTGWVYLKT